jgi:hypothetical protein
MKRYLFVFVLSFFIVCSSSFCASLTEVQKRDYGILESAVMFASDKVIGEYGDNIPDDFSAGKFMEFLEGKIPKDYYEALKKYRIDVRQKRTYYLLLIYNPRDNHLILFDYNCTPEVDGPVLLEPDKYNIDRLELYDKCR